MDLELRECHRSVAGTDWVINGSILMLLPVQLWDGRLVRVEECVVDVHGARGTKVPFLTFPTTFSPYHLFLAQRDGD